MLLETIISDIEKTAEYQGAVAVNPVDKHALTVKVFFAHAGDAEDFRHALATEATAGPAQFLGGYYVVEVTIKPQMTKEKYAELKIALEEEYQAKREDLAKQYAMANNPVKAGDIITDHFHTIKVQRIGVVTDGPGGFPCCFYDGEQLRKDLRPFKYQADTRMCQAEIIKHTPQG